jgi:hypothetical protein
VYAKKDLPIVVLPADQNENFQYCKFRVKDLCLYLIYRSHSSGAASISGISGLVRDAEKTVCFGGILIYPK